MKKNLTPEVEDCRIKSGFYASDKSYGINGAFSLRHQGFSFLVIVSDQLGWDHVSVSIPTLQRCPTWEEMSFVKSLFFDPEETAFQYHPAADLINTDPYCLHIWRPQQAQIPMPPKIMV